ncbi:MAG: NAD(P)/FAD-dependent oxidoreductase [Gammaproteobacteria bacterium]
MMDPQSTSTASRYSHYDVVIIGGAFAGASSALLLRRWLPSCRVLIVERQQRFGRKMGEATVEVSACFLLRVLGLYDYLSREHLPKHGLRFWFTDGPQRKLEEMSEIGPKDLPRLPAFQLDCSKLDEHLLALAAEAGAEVHRMAKVVAIDCGWPQSRLRIESPDGEHEVTSRWVIDASGRRAFIARRRGLYRRTEEHPTTAVWARWENVADFDGPQVMGSDPRVSRLPRVQASRRLATNHFCGYGWWCWVIPLSGGQTSVGVVYNKKLFRLPGDGHLNARYQAFVTTQPGLRELLSDARMCEDDFLALGHLPYKTSRYMDAGWALVGDAASFIDPYYSPGLDHGSISVYATTQLIEDDLAGRLDDAALRLRIAEHNEQFLRSYDRWIAALYLGKYELMGAAELLGCAFLFDTAMYYLGVLGPIHDDLDSFRHPPFGLANRAAKLFYVALRALNGRLLTLARFRRQAGTYGRNNVGWRVHPEPFGLKQGTLKPLLRGLRVWLSLELEYLRYRLWRGPVEVSRPVPVSLERVAAHRSESL